MSKFPNEHDEWWADCPFCANQCLATVCGHSAVEITPDADAEDKGEYWDYRLLCCRGCNQTYLERQLRTADEITHGLDGQTFYSSWPDDYSSKRDRRALPEWWYRIDDDTLSKVIFEIYRANNTRLYILTAIGMRTAIERSTQLLGIDPNLNFKEKLGELLNQGKIGSEERDILSTLVEAGNAAAHRAWRPSIDNVEVLFSTLEAFFSRIFDLYSAARSFSASIPAKPKIRRRT